MFKRGVDVVRKRDGSLARFDILKIKTAIYKSAHAVDYRNGSVLDDCILNVEILIKKRFKKRIPSVENIQDIAEEVLIRKGLTDVAKSYIIYREKRNQIRQTKIFYNVHDDLKLSVNAIHVLQKRYLLRNEKGEIIENPAEMFRRVAKAVAKAEEFYGKNPAVLEDAFYNMMANLDFIPNSPTLMNAGTRSGQLSACFVLPIEDSLVSIFDSLKAMALIQQSGGGCIAKGSKVFTTFCGIEDIDILYKKINEMKPLIKEKNSEYIDVSDLNIKTISFSKTGFKTARVTKLWKYPHISQAFKITTDNNVSAITSAWHPFFVFDGQNVVEKRADQLKEKDILIGPDESIIPIWPFKEYKTINKIIIDEEISWLIGYWLGDGSIGNSKNGLRFRLFDGRTDNLQKAQKIIKQRFGIKLKIQKDARGLYSLITTNQQFVLTFIKLNGGIIGAKGQNLDIPDFIIKSPIGTISSFIAGLIDSDGYIDNRNGRCSFSSMAKPLAEKLVYLLSALGFNPSTRERKPYGKGKNITYEITLTDATKHAQLKDLLLPYLADSFKRKRLENAQSSTTGTRRRLLIPMQTVSDLLEEIGINLNSSAIHRKSIIIGEHKIFLGRLKWKLGINKIRLLILLDALSKEIKDVKKIEKITFLKRIISGCSVIKKVELVNSQFSFYDFTVEEYQNYLAGIGGFTVIHNTGFSFSKLRGAGRIVGSTKGISSGPVSFIEIFDKTTDVIKQGGKRRGANMAVLRVDHPDIIDFITSKEQEGRLSNFNISVGVTDKFINAVRFNRKFELIDPATKKVVKIVRAKEIFDLIITFAWKTGDPGIIFLDEINRKHVLPGIIESTNPCGEQPLLPWESCNLGSINLVKFVENGEFDWKGLRSCIRLAVHFLDNVIDVNNYVLPEIGDLTRTNRKIGLGVMGFAEMLILLKIPYNSNHALKLGSSLMRFIQTEARQKSYELGIERGSFLSFKQSKLAKRYKAMRNATVTTIAPTGTISIIAGTSSGIEPLFAVSYVRNVLEGTKLFETNSLFEDIARERGFYSPELMMRITRTRNLEGMKDVPDDVKKLFLTAHEISPEWHVNMQAVFQKYTDNAVSKTVNLVENATIKDVEKVFWLAHKLGCKGITIYRYNSKSSQVLNLGDKKTVVLESEFAGGCPIMHCGN